MSSRVSSLTISSSRPNWMNFRPVGSSSISSLASHISMNSISSIETWNLKTCWSIGSKDSRLWTLDSAIPTNLVRCSRLPAGRPAMPRLRWFPARNITDWKWIFGAVELYSLPWSAAICHSRTAILLNSIKRSYQGNMSYPALWATSLRIY